MAPYSGGSLDVNLNEFDQPTGLSTSCMCSARIACIDQLPGFLIQFRGEDITGDAN